MGEYLSTIDGADRAALERVYAIAREVVAEAEEGTSYGMAALVYRGKGLIATTRTKKFLSLYPYSGAVIASASDALSDFETTSGSVHYSAATNWQTPSCDASSRHVGVRSTRKHAREARTRHVGRLLRGISRRLAIHPPSHVGWPRRGR